MKINSQALKSLVRGAAVGVGFIVTAINTYIGTGKHFGANKETVIGVGIQVLIALAAVVQRYLDKNDPGLGKVAAPLLADVVTRLTPPTTQAGTATIGQVVTALTPLAPKSAA
jgi:hypothetical protein